MLKVCQRVLAGSEAQRTEAYPRLFARCGLLVILLSILHVFLCPSVRLVKFQRAQSFSAGC